MHIADPCLHYGQEAFEGMKAFETKDGRIVVFRPIENAKRLQVSSDRILVPRIPTDMFLDGVRKVVAANARFVPPYGTGASLYIRPVVFGVEPPDRPGACKRIRVYYIGDPSRALLQRRI